MSNPDVAAAFVAANGEKQRRQPSSLRSTKAPRKGLKATSDKQSVRLAYLAGVKSERISHALLTEGFAACSRCPRRFTTSGAAHKGLDLHHTERRSGGRGYRPGDAGVDAPSKTELLCRSCHRQAEGSEPTWTKGEAV